MIPPPLTSAQLRSARALIRWSAEDLARHCAVSVTTIRRAELMPSATAVRLRPPSTGSYPFDSLAGPVRNRGHPSSLIGPGS